MDGWCTATGNKAQRKTEIFTLGQMQVEPTEKYKYLWKMVSENLTWKTS